MRSTHDSKRSRDHGDLSILWFGGIWSMQVLYWFLRHVQAPVLCDGLAVAGDDDARGVRPDVAGLADEPERHGAVHVIKSNMVVGRDLGAMGLVGLVATLRQSQHGFALASLVSFTARTVLVGEGALVEPFDAIGHELVELFQGMKRFLVCGSCDPSFGKVDDAFGKAFVARFSYASRHDGAFVVIGECKVGGIDQRDAGGRAICRGPAIIGNEHLGHASEVLECIHVALKPAVLLHIPESFGEDQPRARQADG